MGPSMSVDRAHLMLGIALCFGGGALGGVRMVHAEPSGHGIQGLVEYAIDEEAVISTALYILGARLTPPRGSWHRTKLRVVPQRLPHPLDAPSPLAGSGPLPNPSRLRPSPPKRRYLPRSRHPPNRRVLKKRQTPLFSLGRLGCRGRCRGFQRCRFRRR
jgi:hypothetical protein